MVVRRLLLFGWICLRTNQFRLTAPGETN